MANVVFYFTGTGNSLAVARKIARGLGGGVPISIIDEQAEARAQGAGCVGFVFPVYIWGVPPIMVRFLEKVMLRDEAYVFAVGVCGGEGCGTIRQVRRLLRRKGQKLNAGFEVKMPNNYVPLGIPCEKRRQKIFAEASGKIAGIVASVQRKDTVFHKGRPLFNWLFSGIFYNASVPFIPRMDKRFFADDRCNGCSLCAQVCPAGNIEMNNGKPVWLHRCEQCWACFHWCPQRAVQTGKHTAGKERYHHPEAKITDLIRR